MSISIQSVVDFTKQCGAYVLTLLSAYPPILINFATQHIELTVTLVVSLLGNVILLISGHCKNTKIRRLEGYDVERRLTQEKLDRENLEIKQAEEIKDFDNGEFQRDQERRQNMLKRHQNELADNQAEIDNLEKIKVEKKL